MPFDIAFSYYYYFIKATAHNLMWQSKPTDSSWLPQFKTSRDVIEVWCASSHLARDSPDLACHSRIERSSEQLKKA